jgi:hypothetical protein
LALGGTANPAEEAQDGILLDAHAKRVNVLVNLVKNADGLDDHVVRAVHIELDLGARVAVSETKLWQKRKSMKISKKGIFLFSFLFIKRLLGHARRWPTR